MQSIVWVLLCAALSNVGVAAQEHSNGWRVVGGLGLGGGGETITSGTITNVSNNTVIPFEIKPGEGPQFRLGAEFSVGSTLALQTTIGHSAVAPMGFNGSLTFTTVPLEVVALAPVGNSVRLGLGVRKAFAEMSGTGVASNSPVLGVYEASVGGVAEVQYFFGAGAGSALNPRTQFGVSARYITETYKRNGYTFDGNHYELGVVLYY